MLSHERVLVTGARLPAALEVVRALRSQGAAVWTADTLRFTPAGASNYSRGYLRLPSPVFDPGGFRERLLNHTRRLGISLIVPASEEIFALARLRDELAPDTRLFAPDLTLLRDLHSKWRILELAADCGARIPRTERAETSHALRELSRQHPQWILKPEFSRGGYRTKSGRGAIRVNKGEAWLAQEFVAGREISIFAIAHEGRALVSATYLPKYRTGRGASLYFEPHHSPAAEAFVARIAGKLGITGQLGFDLVEEPDGGLALLECNPRATSGVHLLGDGQWARAYFGEPVDSARDTVPCCSRFGVLLTRGLHEVRRGRWRELRADLARSRDSCARADDRIPAWVLPLSGAEIALRSLSWPVRLAHAYTFDLEWNGEER